MSLNREDIQILCQANPEEVIVLIEKQEARIAYLETRFAELVARLNQKLQRK